MVSKIKGGLVNPVRIAGRDECVEFGDPGFQFLYRAVVFDHVVGHRQPFIAAGLRLDNIFYLVLEDLENLCLFPH